MLNLDIPACMLVGSYAYTHKYIYSMIAHMQQCCKLGDLITHRPQGSTQCQRRRCMGNVLRPQSTDIAGTK